MRSVTPKIQQCTPNASTGATSKKKHTSVGGGPTRLKHSLSYSPTLRLRIDDSQIPFAHLGPIQPKLTIAPAGDQYEQEADRTAELVLSRVESDRANNSDKNQDVLRLKRVASSAGGPGESVTSAVAASIQQARGTGQALPSAYRASMEQAFGADFSGVRVHTGGNADRLNRSLRARAFTAGKDVFFKRGEYNATSRAGQELLAHELTHVVQQGAGLTFGKESVIQMERDLAPGTPVNGISEGTRLFGTIAELEEFPGSEQYEVRVTGKEDGSKLDIPYTTATDFAYSATDENEIKAGSSVSFYDDDRKERMTGTVQKITTGPTQQYYTINVLWEEGLWLETAGLRTETIELPEEYVTKADEPPPKKTEVKRPGDLTLVHFHPRGSSVSGSEYVVPQKGKINITSHGLGSGIYGLHGMTKAKVAAQEQQYKSVGVVIGMKNPLVLQNRKHAEEFTEMSKELQRLAEDIRKTAGGKEENIEGAIKAALAEKNERVSRFMTNLRKVLARVEAPFPDERILIDALITFFEDYFKSKDYAAQPVNHLMTLLRFDGVLALEESGYSTFGRGSVAYIPSGKSLRKTTHEQRIYTK